MNLVKATVVLAFELAEWLIYIFGRGGRRAWCEISGGHRYIALACWQGPPGTRATHLRMHCERCRHETRYFDVPVRAGKPVKADF